MAKKQTKTTTSDIKAVKPPTMPVETDPVAPNHYDQRYIEAYCNEPHLGKTAAIIKVGYAGEYPSQEAYRIHNRVRDKIEARLTQNIQELASLAHYQLKEMLKSTGKDVGYSNMATAIKAGFDYAGRKPSDKLEIIEKDQTWEELQQAIAENDRQLKEVH